MNLPSTIRIKNGEKARPTFSPEEFKQRQQNLRALMAENNVDAVLFTSIHNINYFSDFLYCSFGRPYGLVVTSDKVATISANIDGAQPWRRTVGDDNIIFTDWQKDNYFRAVQELLGKSANIKTLGVEYDHITKERLDKLQDAFPNAQICDIGVKSMGLRMLKSPAEIALITNGALVSDTGGYATVEAITEGAPEYEVALHSTQAMVRKIAELYPHAELMDTWSWFQSGINTDGAHNPVTSRQVQKGDILSLNCFSMISGYYTALERTLFFDSCDAASLKLWKINCEVHEKGLSLIKPGVQCKEIAKELNKIYESYGILKYRTFGYGHSFGVLSHYYGREAGLELREDVETVLQPNMVVSMEPMIMIPEGQPGAGGYREHDILVVTESGSENITGFPYGPRSNIVKG